MDKQQSRRQAFNIIARLRVNCAKACEVREQLLFARNQARRKAELLKRTPGHVYSREHSDAEQAERSIAERIGQLNKHLLAFGHSVNDAAPLVDASLTFEELCDVLSVNPVDRREIDGECGFVKLVFVHGLEGSAERRKQDCKSGPLFDVLHLVFCEYLDTPDGKRACDEGFKGFFGGGADDDDRGGAPAPKQPSPSPVPAFRA